MAAGWVIRGSNLDTGSVSLPQNVQIGLRAPQDLLSGREANLSPPSVKNECSYTSVPTIRPHGVDMAHFTFFYSKHCCLKPTFAIQRKANFGGPR
jgi:hypothetical protein